MGDENMIHLAVIGGFTLIVFFTVGRILWQERWVKKRGISTDGVVVALEEKVLKDVQGGKLKTETSYFPVIQYKTFIYEDKTLRYPVDFQASKYKIGDKVPVIYDPKKMERFVIGPQLNSN